MPKPDRVSPRLCGKQSPFYVAHDLDDRRMADLCTRPIGHRSACNWWGYVDNYPGRTR